MQGWKIQTPLGVFWFYPEIWDLPADELSPAEIRHRAREQRREHYGRMRDEKPPADVQTHQREPENAF